MAERRARESSWKNGWPAALAVISVVVAAGFAVGVIAGITWEEPGLVVGYLSGQTEGVEWRAATEKPESGDLSAEAALAAPPDVAAPPPLGQRRAAEPAAPERVQSSPPARPAAPQKAAVAPTQPGAGFAVQVGAFSEKSAAQALADSLRARGYPVYLSPTDASPKSWRVRVGPLATRPEAEKMASKLKAAEKLPTWVLGETS